MHYDAVENAHGLRHDPFKSLVVPRPIGWISSLDENGRINLAPYSFFNAVSSAPHVVMFASGGRKDSVRNIEATKEFVCSLATYDLRQEMNQTSANLGRGADEMDFAGLEPAPSHAVAPPRVAASPVALECTYMQTVELAPSGASPNLVVFGSVVHIHIDDSVIVDGKVDIDRIKPIGRLGYFDYAVVEDPFTMMRPD